MTLLGLAIVFKLWMIFDATRRGARKFWYALLLLPAGDFVYFVAVKLRDFNMQARPPAGAAPPRLSQLEREVERSPSFHNRVRLGWALLEAREPGRAAEYFERALGTHARDKEATLGLGLCRLHRGDCNAAAETLGPLVESSLAYEDYAAALALAEALFSANRKREAFELLRAVIRDGRRIEHQLLLARYQLRGQAQAEARATLRGALEAFESQPDFERRRNGAVATEARSLLRTLEQPAS